jgi:hypothetical protein
LGSLVPRPAVARSIGGLALGAVVAPRPHNLANPTVAVGVRALCGAALFAMRTIATGALCINFERHDVSCCSVERLS